MLVEIIMMIIMNNSFQVVFCEFLFEYFCKFQYYWCFVLSFSSPNSSLICQSNGFFWKKSPRLNQTIIWNLILLNRSKIWESNKIQSFKKFVKQIVDTLLTQNLDCNTKKKLNYVLRKMIQWILITILTKQTTFKT